MRRVQKEKKDTLDCKVDLYMEAETGTGYICVPNVLFWGLQACSDEGQRSCIADTELAARSWATIAFLM